MFLKVGIVTFFIKSNFLHKKVKHDILKKFNLFYMNLNLKEKK